MPDEAEQEPAPVDGGPACSLNEPSPGLELRIQGLQLPPEQAARIVESTVPSSPQRVQSYPSAGGDNIAVLSDGRIVHDKRDGSIVVMDLTGAEQQFAPAGYGIAALAVLDDDRVVSGNINIERNLLVWDVDNPGEPIVLDGHTIGISGLAVLRDGRIASSSGDGTVKLWDLQDPQNPITLTAVVEPRPGTDGFLGVFELSDGRIVSSRFGALVIWDVQDPTNPEWVRYPNQVVSSGLAESDGTLYAGQSYGRVEALDMRVARGQDRSLGGFQLRENGGLMAMTLLRDGRVAAAGPGGSIEVWDPAVPESRVALFGHQRGVTDIEQMPDGRLVSSGFGGSITIWDLESGEMTPGDNWHRDKVLAAASIGDGRILSTSEDNTIRVWCVGNVGAAIVHDQGWRITAVRDADDGTVIFGDENGRLYRASPDDLSVYPERYGAAPQRIVDIETLANGMVVTSGYDREVRVWDSEGLTEIAILTREGRRTDRIVVTNDDRVVGAGTGELLVWDVDRPDVPAVLMTENVESVAVLADGRFAVGRIDGTITVADAAELESSALFGNHDESVVAVLELADGRLATASWDGTLLVWDLADTTQPAMTFTLWPQQITDLFPGPEGTLGVIAGEGWLLLDLS